MTDGGEEGSSRCREEITAAEEAQAAGRGKKLSPLGDLQLSMTLLEGGRTAATVMHSNSEHSKIQAEEQRTEMEKRELWWPGEKKKEPDLLIGAKDARKRLRQRREVDVADGWQRSRRDRRWWWSREMGVVVLWRKGAGADVKRMKSKMKRVVRLCYDDGGGYSEAGRRRTKRT